MDLENGPSHLRISEVSMETKRLFIPHIRELWADQFPVYSIFYRRPAESLKASRHGLEYHHQILPPATDLSIPAIQCEVGDAADLAIALTNAGPANDSPTMSTSRAALLCPSSERRPGGDWETSSSGFEERLCRRSNLSDTLSSSWDGSDEVSSSSSSSSKYPLPPYAGLFSENVVVFRGSHQCHYERWDPETWQPLPVISVAPIRRPKLRDQGMQYSFKEERDMMIEKMKGALMICIRHGYTRLVIGAFGTGGGCRNPPQEVAEMWRDLLLFDQEVRGFLSLVVFAFEDAEASTMKAIYDDMVRKDSKYLSRNKGKMSTSASRVSSAEQSMALQHPSDLEIFQYVFHPSVVSQLAGQSNHADYVSGTYVS